MMKDIVFEPILTIVKEEYPFDGFALFTFSEIQKWQP